MSKFTEKGTGKRVDLNDGNFKAKGGEGSVYIIGDRAYKVCAPGFMIPAAKFQELVVLNHPRIIRPETILLDANKDEVGYSMMAVPRNPSSLAKILTKAYRVRENMPLQIMPDLVLQIRDIFEFTHGKKVLIVDANENNFMVTDDWKDVYAIDVNAWETPHFPAPVINPSIQDHQVTNCKWTELSDWYSFCIIAWWMFTANHPYRIRHPVAKVLDTAMIDCMIANKSILDPQAIFAEGAVYFPFEDYIPGGKDGSWMQWFRSILVDGKRSPPPADYRAVLAPIVAKVREIIGSNKFMIDLVHDFQTQITGIYNQGKEVVVTQDAIFVNRIPYPRPMKRLRVCFTPELNKVIVVSVENERLALYDLEAQRPIPCEIGATDIMAYGGRIYMKCGKSINQLGFIERNSVLLPTSELVATILEQATQLFQGVAFQDMFGNHIASFFPKSGQHYQVKLAELEKYKIADAKFENGVLMVVGTKGNTGDYDRLVFRFSKDYLQHDCRIEPNVPLIGLNFTVLENGLCVCLAEDGRLEVFPNKLGMDVNRIADKGIPSDMHLCHAAGVQFAQGSKLFSFGMRRP
jgi:hypothetical protein